MRSGFSKLVVAGRLAARSLVRHPFFFLSAQIPNVVTGYILEVSLPKFQNEKELLARVVAAAPFIALFFISTFYVQAATCLGVSKSAQNERPSWGQIIPVLWKRSLPLIGSAVIVGGTVLIGFSAILPGIILFALYLYVPNFVVLYPSLPLTAALSKSWRFARKEAWGMVAVMTILGLVAVATFVFEDFLQNIEHHPERSPWPFRAFDLLFSTVTGMCLHVWLAHFFVEATQERTS